MLEAVDWDQRFKLPRPSRTAPVSPGLVGGESALCVDTNLEIDGVDVPNFEACPEQSGLYGDVRSGDICLDQYRLHLL